MVKKLLVFIMALGLALNAATSCPKAQSVSISDLTAYSATVNITDTTHDGINNHEMSRVYAYPNPCTNTLYITNENAERIELYNANGKLLEAVENRDTQVTLNMQQYPAGLYLLKVGNGVQKILKK